MLDFKICFNRELNIDKGVHIKKKKLLSKLLPFICNLVDLWNAAIPQGLMLKLCFHVRCRPTFCTQPLLPKIATKKPQLGYKPQGSSRKKKVAAYRLNFTVIIIISIF